MNFQVHVRCDKQFEGCDAEVWIDGLGYEPHPDGWVIEFDGPAYADGVGGSVSAHCPDWPDCTPEARDEALREDQIEHGITPRRVQ